MKKIFKFSQNTGSAMIVSHKTRVYGKAQQILKWQAGWLIKFQRIEQT